MPTNKSALKRLRTGEKARIRNKSRKTEIKTFEKKFKSALTENDTENAEKYLQNLSSKLDKAVKSGTIHKNTSNRKKSRLGIALNKAKKAS